MLKVFHVRVFYYFSFRLEFIYVFLDYYKLNRLYKALAIQKFSGNSNPTGKGPHNPAVSQPHHNRRIPHYQYQQQQQQHSTNNTNNIPSALSSSPPTPTPMNINQFSPFYTQQSPYLPMPTTVTDSRKSKY
jgi:hypothetical protein